MNVLLQVEFLDSWTEYDIYARLGQPVKDELIPSSKDFFSSAPQYVIEPCSMFNSQLFSENVLLVDFGSAFFVGHAPAPEELSFTTAYGAPEAIPECQVGEEADMWVLGCVLFEFRAGIQFINDWAISKDVALKQITQTLGRLPDRLWNAWDARSQFFDDDGNPASSCSPKYPLEEMISEIGTDDGEGEFDVKYRDLLDPKGLKVPHDEAVAMERDLRRLLALCPQDRLYPDQESEQSRLPQFGQERGAFFRWWKIVWEYLAYVLR